MAENIFQIFGVFQLQLKLMDHVQNFGGERDTPTVILQFIMEKNQYMLVPVISNNGKSNVIIGMQFIVVT